MSRTVAVIWHALFSIAAGVLYFLFVLPRWWELSGVTSHTLGTVLRIAAGALIGLAALPVVFTWLRTRRPEYGTPELALRLRMSSIALHVLGGVLIVGTAISEIWFTLDEAGRWLFGIYGAAAAISLLGIFSFYLAFIAELPAPPPRPLKKKERKSRLRRRKEKIEAAGDDAAETAEPAEEAEPVTVSTAGDEAEGSEEAQEGAVTEVAGTVEAEAAESPDDEADTEAPAPADTLAAEPERGGLRNQRPSGKLRRPRLRRKSGGVAVED
ncbi:MAG: hypothetical protein WAM92_19875 [Mycobacterium sp.]